MIKTCQISDPDAHFGYAILQPTADDMLLVINHAVLRKTPLYMRETIANEALAMVDEPRRSHLAEVINLEERRAALAAPAVVDVSTSQMQVTDR